MENKKIKWGCIQPLTGGMYIGASEAIGHDAEWILSYPGLSTIKNGKAGNEYHLLEWLNKNNRNVPYYTFNRGMFQNDYDLNPKFVDNKKPDFTDLDLVVAVPVCSGLSMVTSASKDTKDTRNCNMLYLTKYTLNVIKPKVYIFENAPTLVSDRGDEVRSKLEEFASEANYSILYYKTDTVLHQNCQIRPRTFVIFTKTEFAPIFDFEQNRIKLDYYLKLIHENASQQTAFKMSALNVALIEYSKYKYGNDWRNKSHKRPIIDIVNNNDYDNFLNFVVNLDIISDIEKQKINKLIRHAEYKKSIGMNFMSIDVVVCKDTIPSIQFKCIQSILHPNEDRLLTVRECLHFMGMPDDFELLGDINSNYQQIGQNVPVKTAKFIVEQAININKYSDKKVLFIDNIKQKIKY